MLSLFTNIYLQFSDAAKFADIARSVISGLGYNGKFSFWSSGIVDLSQRAAFPSPWIPPVMPYSIALAFKLFGISDLSVVIVSMFYFVLLILFTFLLGKKIFGNLTGALAAVAVAANMDFLSYAISGATEPLFALEIVAGTYFVSLRKTWSDVITIIFGALLYFTRPQAFIYIAGIILLWLLINLRPKKAVTVFIGILVFGFLIDYLVLPKFAGKYFIYSVTGRGLGTITEVAAGGSASDSLRGLLQSSSNPGIGSIIKKFLYNLYNFYKLAPQILNPYLLVMFGIGVFKWGKDKLENSLKIAVIFMFSLTLAVAALSVPFFRYIHPIIPLIYIFSAESLIWITAKIFRNEKLVMYTSILLIIVFAVGQTLGVIFLDSRYEAKTHNSGKAPVYVTLSRILNQNTKPNDFIVTNLDTWASWYGDRRTIWYPVNPKQLIEQKADKIPFDAIYLTSYQMDDQNNYMGFDWRLVFNNPYDSEKWTCEGCGDIAKEFELKAVYRIPASEDYERLDSRAVLLVRK